MCSLLEKLNRMLGKDRAQKIVIVGCGTKGLIRNINIGMELENLFYHLRFSGKLGDAARA